LGEVPGLYCAQEGYKVAQIHIVQRVYGGVSAYKRSLNFEEFQLANGGWVRQAIELYADRSQLTPVSLADVSQLSLGLASARSNWTWIQIAARSVHQVSLVEVVTAFKELERSLEETVSISPYQRHRSSAATRKALRRFLEDQGMSGIERIHVAFVTSFPAHSKPRSLISDHADGAYPLGATPHSSKVTLDSNLLARFELTKTRIEQVCELELDRYFERSRRLTTFLERGAPNEDLIRKLLEADTRKIAHTRALPQWLVDADLIELLIAYHAILLRHSPVPSASFACTRTNELGNLLSRIDLLPAQSGAVTLDIMLELLSLYIGNADTVIAAVLALQLATGWNVSSVLAMTEVDIADEEGLTRIQGFKTKTGDATPPVYLSKDDRAALKAIAFLRQKASWLKQMQWFASGETGFWASPSRIRRGQPGSYRQWAEMLRRFLEKTDLPRFTFEQVRNEVLARETVRYGGLEVARRMAGHDDELTTGHYLDQMLFQRRNSAINLQFQRRVEKSVIYRLEDDGNLPDDDLLYPVGDGTSCSNSAVRSEVAEAKEEELCEGKWCHEENGCPHNRILLDKERIEEVARISRYYATNWKRLFSQNPDRFQRYDMPVLLFNVALRGVVAVGPMRHELSQIEKALNGELK
jgi:integrase